MGQIYEDDVNIARSYQEELDQSEMWQEPLAPAHHNPVDYNDEKNRSVTQRQVRSLRLV